jgi:hypothetical protein
MNKVDAEQLREIAEVEFSDIASVGWVAKPTVFN